MPTTAHDIHQKRALPAGRQVKEVSENPLANNRGGKFARDQLDPGEETSAMETRILESSITKICSLLAVGFGDAGAEVRALAALAEQRHNNENIIHVIVHGDVLADSSGRWRAIAPGSNLLCWAG